MGFGMFSPASGCGCCERGPCATICATVRDACAGTLARTVVPVAGATVTLVQGGVTTTCTTGADGRCCAGGGAGAFTISADKAGYVRFPSGNPASGTAACPPPPSPVNHGADYPGTLADDASIGSTAWSSPGNAGAADSAYATATSSGSTPTHYLKGTNFGFAVPTDGTETIVGVLLEVFCKADAAATAHDVRMVVGGSVVGNNQATTAGLSTGAGGTLSYGGTNSLAAWGVAPTPAQVNATDFGFVFSAKAPGSGGTPALVQAPAGSVAFGGNATATFAAATTAGNLLIAVVTTSALGTVAAPSGWSTAVAATPGSGQRQSIFYRANAPATTTVTAATTGRWSMEIAEYSGMGATPTVAATNTGTTDSGAVTTTGAALLVAGLGNGLSTPPSGPSAGFALQSSGTVTAACSAFLWQYAAAAGTFTASCSTGTTSIGTIAAFTPTGGGATTISVDYLRAVVYGSTRTYEVTLFLNADTVECSFGKVLSLSQPAGVAGATWTVTGPAVFSATTDAAGRIADQILKRAVGYSWTVSAPGYTSQSGTFNVSFAACPVDPVGNRINAGTILLQP
jgi:hypothetical protein